MRFLAGVAAFAAALAMAAGCTLGALDDLSKGSASDAGSVGDGSNDATTSSIPDATTPVVDGASAVDAEAGADAGLHNSCGAPLFGTEVPLVNPGFELGCTSGWSTFAASVTDETTLVSQGSVACRLCANLDGADQFHLNQDVQMMVAPGQVFEVVGCVRTAPTFPVATDVGAELTTNGGSTGQRGESVVLTDTYQPVRASFTMDGNYTDVNADVNAAETSGTCFLIDDVRLFRVQ